jgi:hypothetical protein
VIFINAEEVGAIHLLSGLGEDNRAGYCKELIGAFEIVNEAIIRVYIDLSLDNMLYCLYDHRDDSLSDDLGE